MKKFDDGAIVLRLLRQYEKEIWIMNQELLDRMDGRPWTWFSRLHTGTNTLQLQVRERQRFVDSIKLHTNHVERMRRESGE
jgi:hypothetical protein